MKIVFVTNELSHAEVIRQTLKFVSPPPDVRLEVLSPLADPEREDTRGLELPEHPIYHFITDPHDFTAINASLDELNADLIIFGDKVLANRLAENRKWETACLFLDNRLSFMFLAVDHFPECTWFKADSGVYSNLVNEPALQPLTTTVYPDSAAWSIAEKADSEVLLTQNADLVNYLCLTSAKHCRLFHLGWDHPALDLNFGMLKEQDQAERIHYILQTAYDISHCGLKVDITRLKHMQNTRSGSSAYASFAEDYDDYMAHVDYDLWLKSLLQWQKRYSDIKLKRILEIACGTANVSGLLIFDGYEVDACDSSWQMLRMADQKVFKPRLFLRSMTEPLPKLDYELIICLFDSINYLQKDEEIRILLDNAYESLTEGGLFIFDISTILNSRDNFADTFNLTHKKDTYMFHHAEYDEFTAKQKSHLYYFTKEHGSYRSEIERHVQRVYRHQEMIRLIHRSKFDLVGIHCTESPRNLLPKAHTDLDEQYPRLFFVLKKQAD